LNDPFEIPSLEEIEQMDRQRSQAIESLEIYNGYVKCQRCGIAVPIIAKLTRPGNDRIAILQKKNSGLRIALVVIILIINHLQMTCELSV
jgi:hypothetical protein